MFRREVPLRSSLTWLLSSSTRTEPTKQDSSRQTLPTCGWTRETPLGRIGLVLPSRLGLAWDQMNGEWGGNPFGIQVNFLFYSLYSQVRWQWQCSDGDEAGRDLRTRFWQLEFGCAASKLGNDPDYIRDNCETLPHYRKRPANPSAGKFDLFRPIFNVMTNARWTEALTLCSTFTTSSWTWASRPSPPSSPRIWRSSSPPPTILSGRTEPTWSCQWPPGPDLLTGELGDAAWWMKWKWKLKHCSFFQYLEMPP